MADEEKLSGSNLQPPPFFDNSYFPSTVDLPPKPQSSNFRTLIVAFLTTVVATLLVVTAARSHPLSGLTGEESSGSKKITYCAGVTTTEEDAIYRAVGQMRRTSEGNHLANQILGKSLCFGVQEIAYNGGYFSPGQRQGDSSDFRIIIDRTELRILSADEIGAMLVHEATHAERYFEGKSCSETDDCTILPNGIAVSEEIAAHAAEARFWIDIHGKPDDDTFTGSVATGSLDELAAAYDAGPEAFRVYVIELRSDPREGQGL
jgi:hypothetical protein